MRYASCRGRHPGFLFKRSVITVLAILPLVGVVNVGYAAGTSGAVSAVREFSVPAGPLGEALTTFASQAGVSLQASAGLVRGKQSAGLQGNFSVSAGFNALLAGSGLEIVRTAQGVYVLRKAADNELTPVSVTAGETSLGEAAPIFNGGQVSTANRLGLLGNMDIMEAPFNVTGYTSELITDQQARSVADVLVNNDSSVRLMGSRGDLLDDYTVRGFPVSGQDISLNGMYGLLPYWRVPVESAERVELLRGPSAALNGMPPSGSVGGAINVVPKRAGEAPLTRLTMDYSSDAQLGTHLDVGRRFGEENRFGVRFNGVYREGDTALEDQSRESPLASLGLDYRGERLKLSADLLYQKEKLDGLIRPVLLSAGAQIPDAPDTSKLYGMKNSYSDAETFSAVANAEFALHDNLEAYASFGGRRNSWDTEAANVLISNADTGDSAFSSARQRTIRHTLSSQAGLKGRFETGDIRHEVTFGVTRYDHKEGMVFQFYAPVPGNLYAPPVAINNDTSALDGHIPTTNESVLSGMGITDRLFLFDDRFQLTLGARRQWIDSTSYDQASGAVTNDYQDQAWTPMVGVAYLPTSSLTFYGNAVQGLSPGQTAPITANNAGEQLAPYKSEQYELGMKYDSGSWGGTWALFQIEKPNAIIDMGNNFTDDGEQRNRGLELNLFGEPLENVRVLGAVTFMDTEQTRTQGGANDGREARGVADHQANIGIDWDLPFLAGASVNARWIYTGEAYYNADNSLTVPSWERYDAGAKYRFNAGGTPITLRANVENLLGEDYWQAASAYDAMNIGTPRTVSLAVTADF